MRISSAISSCASVRWTAFSPRNFRATSSTVSPCSTRVASSRSCAAVAASAAASESVNIVISEPPTATTVPIAMPTGPNAPASWLTCCVSARTGSVPACIWTKTSWIWKPTCPRPDLIEPDARVMSRSTWFSAALVRGACFAMRSSATSPASPRRVSWTRAPSELTTDRRSEIARSGICRLRDL